MSGVPIKVEEIQEAYQKIRNEGLVIVPTRVGYVLLGNTDKAIQKMFELKGRPLTKPCVVLTKRSLLEQIAVVPEKYLPFINAIEDAKLLCGFILKRKEHPFFDSLSPFANKYSMLGDGTSCFVINASDYIQHLVDQAEKDGTFIVGSSANQSGTGNEGFFERIPEKIRQGVDGYVEHNEYVHQEYNPETREQGVMVDLTKDRPVIIRKGLKLSQIENILRATTGYFEYGVNP